ncbi:MAG: hypothetical protein H6506_02200 [Calditrichaeota bacterium]|nr:hypothetical protein [Calditrichota bacterium]MCB9367071.1 hypothetical protein [Calditrichota bacterium]MCB9391445.1 hypothetical protein [Calditrichota bacterium]
METKKLSFALAVLAAFVLIFVSCSEDRVTSSYDTHPTNWMNEFSDEWHGTAALPSKGESCAACHSIEEPRPITLELGDPEPESTVSTSTYCYECHNYPHGADYGQMHDDDIRAHAWTSLPSCQNCHGQDFSGARTGVSCNECHTLDGGPAACNTCHGMPPTTTRPLGNQNPGAHSAHAQYACTECHRNVTDLGHIDALPGDVNFDFARISTANNFPANYTSPSNCATWCHSNLHNGAPMVDVSWNTGQTFTQCRSCHQVPPTAASHPTESRCHFCHLNVDPNSNYNDANQIRFLPGDTLHVNGVVNAIFP